MNCLSVLHQIEFAVHTLVRMIEILEENDLEKRPSPDKRSIGEVLEHLATLFEADWRISKGASKEEMDEFYAGISYPSLESIKEGLLSNYETLRSRYSKLSNEELLAKTTSYWGVTYTRYEWLLEILAHLYHHRGQLHAMLTYCYGKDPGIPLFE
ncbi:DinB family protein [Paenibacillus sp. DMB20]|uniref:DinB family protein n=1 Tax=Paenibacillus sp. DMB20 TaxID=1642570 RepID=UPI0006277626|nr:DinB family protein [Paenibacillus sp. DMB20]KKO54305.1 damage-inducible protein DinB [Paenibacillus sp. DMB20]